jgi:demethylmenaquinone methyltransferase/2-methoxy-6-polyprenyl-1,4-benzoquinol methylase
VYRFLSHPHAICSIFGLCAIAMTHDFYSPGEHRAAKVNDLFAAIASRYDLINDVQSFGLHRLWKRRLIRLAGVQPGMEALDVCCGTGDLTLSLARAGATAVGLDFSEPMLAVARARSARLEVTRGSRGSEMEKRTVPGSPRFLQGDAQHLPFGDDQFDVVTVGYGLRNLADWRLGLGEMRRVTKPGGRVLVLDFGKPDNTLWRRIWFAYLRWAVPVMGRALCGNPAAYAYILESLEPYPAQPGVAAEMRALGLENVRVFNLLGGVMSIHCAEKPVAPKAAR